jgi:hypothetical protein
MLERVRTTWVIVVVSLPPAALALIACEHDADALSDTRTYNTRVAAIGSDTRAASPVHAQRDEAAFERFAGSAFSVEQIVRTLAASALTDLRPVGSTSVVLRANLAAPFRAALKLATHERPLAPATEAAAYRLSRCLGLTTVPPAVLRRLPYRGFEQALDRRYMERWPELLPRLVIDPLSQVEGVAIFWIEGLRDLPIAAREARQPVLQALVQGSAVAPDQQLMAAQLSDLSVFDLLLGNGDRWSGGNVQGDAAGQWLYIRDHDLAFASHLRPEVEARLLSQLAQVERFSRGLIGRVRLLNELSFEREWAKDPLLASRGAWLKERVMPGVMQRRSKLLDHVQSLVRRHGEDAVLAFP